MQVSTVKRMVLSLVVCGALVVGCDTDQSSEPVDAQSLSETRKVIKEWSPQAQPEGPLEVDVEPASADVEIDEGPEERGVIKTKVTVKHFGYENGRPRSPNSQYVTITLTRPNFLSQKYHIMAPKHEATATLVRMLYEKGARKRSFLLAQETYRLPIAVPTYIPAGFSLEDAHFQADIVPRYTDSGGITMVWAKQDKQIRMTFMPKRSKSGPSLGFPPGPTTGTIGGQEPYTLGVHDSGSLTVLETEPGADLTLHMGLTGLAQHEISQIVDGLRLISPPQP